jgi:hypothetical protein
MSNVKFKQLTPLTVWQTSPKGPQVQCRQQLSVRTGDEGVLKSTERISPFTCNGTVVLQCT